jgi:hypothetical protein
MRVIDIGLPGSAHRSVVVRSARRIRLAANAGVRSEITAESRIRMRRACFPDNCGTAARISRPGAGSIG